MKKVDGSLNISAIVECPHCDNTIDLFDIMELRDDGHIYSKLLSNDRFGTDDFGEVITCPDCKNDFKVGAICW